MSLQEAQHFTARFVTGEYTSEEYAAFLQWLKVASVEELAVIADIHESNDGKWVSGGPSAEWIVKMEQKLNARAEEGLEVEEDEETTVMNSREWEEIRKWRDEEEKEGVMPPVVRMQPERKVRWNAWMTAASVVVALSAGTFVYIHRMGSASGERQDREKLLSMTVTNPRGGAQREVVLEDGSRIWLNAGSVLKYPRHFTGSERVVELSGEAFFDIGGSFRSPFRVLIKDAEVEVLGTYFAIMAYEDEPGSRTTLVYGAVKVTSRGQSVVLKPGEQAEIPYLSPGATAEIIVHPAVDTKSVLAWKGGIYRFQRTDLRAVMRELARVYGVTFQYQPTMANPQVDGILNLNSELSTVLKQLESCSTSYKIHFTINQKIVNASSV